MRIPNFTRQQDFERGNIERAWKHDDTGHYVTVLEEEGYNFSVAIADQKRNIIGRLFKDIEKRKEAKKLGVETARQFPDEFEKYHDGNNLVVATYGENQDTTFEDETNNEVIVSAEDVRTEVNQQKARTNADHNMTV